MRTCEQCGLKWNEPPTSCPKCQPQRSVVEPSMPVQTTSSAPRQLANMKAISKCMAVADSIQASGIIITVLFGLAGVLAVILSMLERVFVDFVLGCSFLLAGFIWYTVFSWACELLRSHGRTEEMQARMLEELRSKDLV